MKAQIHLGDCLEVMRGIPDGSIDLTVTSPPYDNLRTYNGTLDDWVPEKWQAIIADLYRVTKPGGVVVWVVKDSITNGNKSLTSYRQALFFQSIGFSVYDVVLYAKKSGLLPHAGRYRDAFEYCFIMSKGKPSAINLICDKPNVSAGRNSGRKTVREQDGSLTHRASKDIPAFGTRTNIWEYATGKGVGHSDAIAYQHPATFPEALARDHILSWSNEGDTVLDPFLGSGTTGKMALQLGRKFIGIDREPSYIAISETRIAQFLEAAE